MSDRFMYSAVTVVSGLALVAVAAILLAGR